MESNICKKVFCSRRQELLRSLYKTISEIAILLLSSTAVYKQIIRIVKCLKQQASCKQVEQKTPKI